MNAHSPAPARDPRLTPARPDLADERLRGTLEAARFVPGEARTVVWPVAPLRRQPRPDAPLDTEALMGEPATLYEAREGWAWVQLGRDGYVGYVPEEALGSPDETATHRVSALRTFVYAGPDLKSQVLNHLPLGAEIRITGATGGYGALAAGGYVWAGHLTAPDINEPDFVAVAERLVGVPYLWGGKSSLGLDCSGLVQIALAMTGVPAPRDTDMQMAALGHDVTLAPDLSGLCRGDLVFWRGHVGIMQDGTRLLHANGHHMAVASEPIATAAERILSRSFGPITGVRRFG